MTLARFRHRLAALLGWAVLAVPAAQAMPGLGWLPDLVRVDWEGEARRADGDRAPLATLLAKAREMARHEHVPYVWGGNKLGDEASCDACRSCLLSGKAKRRSVERRHLVCDACKSCGVDCSHFVNKVFREAGLGFPYASTREMMRLARSGGLSRLGFAKVGADAVAARPGDLLLYPRHVVMLLEKKDGTRGDFVHVSRSARHDRLGGIEIVEDHDLRKFRGRLLLVLRHEELAAPAPADPEELKALLSAHPSPAPKVAE